MTSCYGNTWSRDLVDLRCLWRLPLRKVLRAWIHAHLLDLRGRGSRKQMRGRRYQKCTFICVVTAYGNREVCRLAAGEADVFCLSTGQLTALKVPLQASTIIVPDRPSSLKTALFWQGSSSLGGKNRKPEIRTHTQLRSGRRTHSDLTKLKFT